MNIKLNKVDIIDSIFSSIGIPIEINKMPKIK